VPAVERWQAAAVTSAWRVTLGFPVATLALVMGLLNFVIQIQGHAYIAEALQLEETVRGTEFICTLLLDLYMFALIS
jgi:hypothetical protein